MDLRILHRLNEVLGPVVDLLFAAALTGSVFGLVVLTYDCIVPAITSFVAR